MRGEKYRQAKRPDFVPYGFCWCGCGEKTVVATHNDRWMGFVKGEPKHYIAGHCRKPAPCDYIVNAETGCWEWQRTRSSGYGIIGSAPFKYAHRVYYERAKGPIPLGLQIDHLCRNTGCVNPDHLEAVTQAENLRRAPSVKLNKASVQAIRDLAASGKLKSQSIANRFGISEAQARHVITGRYWRD